MFLGLVAYAIYGGACILALILCFSPDSYNRIDEALNLQLAPNRLGNTLDSRMPSVDSWLKEKHRMTGLVLAFLSIVDLKMLLNVIDRLF